VYIRITPGNSLLTAESLREWLQKRPFQPFLVKTSDGEAYEVRHPAVAFLTRTEIVIGLAERNGIPSRHRTVLLLHVTAIEPIDASAAA
jgi:hypothetical protein